MEFVTRKSTKRSREILPGPSSTPPQGALEDPRNVLLLRRWFRLTHGEPAWKALNALEKRNKRQYVDALTRIQLGLGDEVATGLTKGTKAARRRTF